MSETFLLKKDLKDIRGSFFERGFAIPVDKQAALSRYLRGGALRHGEKRTIKILLGGKSFEVTLRSVGFNRKNYPNHSEIWQVNWTAVDAVAATVKKIFSRSYNAEEVGECFALYSTDAPDTFCFEPIFERTLLIPQISEFALENLLASPQLSSNELTLLEDCNLLTIRKMTLSLSAELKRNYDYRCQICGRNVGEFYGVDLAECHHIEPFSRSLNNDATNLIIVCPNHHRIIHAAAPTFDRERKLYLYPNGCTETLQLNEHL